MLLAGALCLVPASQSVGQTAGGEQSADPVTTLDLSAADAPGMLDREDFNPCPVEELREYYRVRLPVDAGESFAVEEEVLRLCRDRQQLINEIVDLAEEFPLLLGDLRTANAVAQVAAEQIVPAVPSAVPGAAAASAPGAPAASPVPEAPRDVAEAPPARAAAVGEWDHAVVFVVRGGDEPWRARISSVRTPPPKVSRDPEGRPVIVQSSPDPPRIATVEVGEFLADGSAVTFIDIVGVQVRPPGAAEGSAHWLPGMARGPDAAQPDTGGFIVRKITR